MKLRYGDLLQLLERMHALPGSRRTATESRLKNFSRIDFPNAARVGSGERAEYAADQVVQLLVAFELLRQRMPPAAIAEIVRTEWTAIVLAFASAANALEQHPAAAGDRRRPLLLFDTVALHEAGKTVRRGELLSTVEVVAAEDLADRGGWRSALAVDPTAILKDAAEQVPWLRRSIDGGILLAAVKALGQPGTESAGQIARTQAWHEAGYGVRRALADTLAVLRATLPLPEREETRLPAVIARRLKAALDADGDPLSRMSLDGWSVRGSLLVYLNWIGVPRDGDVPAPSPAEVLVIHAKAQTPQHLHETLVEAVLGEAGAPLQDN